MTMEPHYEVPVLGKSVPRLYTRPLRDLTPETSLGYDVIDYAEERGVELMPWQEQFLIRALEVAEGHTTDEEDPPLRFNIVVLLVSRQNGKTLIVELLTRWWMDRYAKSMTLGVSTNLELAREPFLRVAEAAEEEGIQAKLRTGTIDTSLWTKNGSRYKVAAATRRGGRSLSVDLLIMDELREMLDDHDSWNALTGTTTARPNSLTVTLSNAGDVRSVVLSGLRENALIDTKAEAGVGIFEWSAPEGAETDEPEALAQANPALGYTLTWKTLMQKRASMPEPGFRTEHMCQWVATTNPAFSSEGWLSTVEEAPGRGTHKGNVYLGIDVSLELDHVTLVAATPLPDGRIRVGVVAAWDSTTDARRELRFWVEKIKPRGVAWFPTGPANALGPVLTSLGATTITNPAEAFGMLAEAIFAREVLHVDDPLLNSHILGASKVPVGDGFKVTRKGAPVDAAYALAAAVRLARGEAAKKPVGKPRILLAEG